MSTAEVSTIDTVVGPFTTIAARDGAVLASGWTAEPDNLLAGIHRSLRPTDVTWRHDLGPVTAAVAAYHDGDCTAIDEIAVRQRSGEFVMHAWDVLRKTPPGELLTYTELAALAGRPAAIRPAATVCAHNSAALFVPCHRVVGSESGAVEKRLHGFRWGVDIKLWLLRHEGAA